MVYKMTADEIWSLVDIDECFVESASSVVRLWICPICEMVTKVRGRILTVLFLRPSSRQAACCLETLAPLHQTMWRYVLVYQEIYLSWLSFYAVEILPRVGRNTIYLYDGGGVRIIEENIVNEQMNWLTLGIRNTTKKTWMASLLRFITIVAFAGCWLSLNISSLFLFLVFPCNYWSFCVLQYKERK